MMERVETLEAPQAIGPYSQAIRSGDFLFVSGQIPLNPKSGTLVEGGIEVQTGQVMKNIQAILKAAKLDLGRIVKTTVFLKNMDDFSTFNSVYEKFLREPFPARATVEVSRLPKNVLIEIEAVAYALA